MSEHISTEEYLGLHYIVKPDGDQWCAHESNVQYYVDLSNKDNPSRVHIKEKRHGGEE